MSLNNVQIEVKKELFEINKVGLFNKKQLKLILKPVETKTLNFLLNNESKSALVIQDGDKRFLIDTKRVRTKFKIVEKEHKEPYIKINVSINGRIEEAVFSVNNNDLTQYEEIARKVIKKNFYELLVKMQKSKVDPLGFGLRYRGRHFEKNDWETWQSLYPSIKFKVNVDIQIEGTGLVE